MNNTDPKLRETKEWFFGYKDITIEINNFKMKGFPNELEKDCWTYYIYIPLSMLPKKMASAIWLTHHKDNRIAKDKCFFRYEDTWLSILKWNGGATYYKKLEVNGSTDDPRFVKVGCDYQHSWNDGHTYDVDKLAFDARKCVDSLYDLLGVKDEQ